MRCVWTENGLYDFWGMLIFWFLSRSFIMSKMLFHMCRFWTITKMEYLYDLVPVHNASMSWKTATEQKLQSQSTYSRCTHAILSWQLLYLYLMVLLLQVGCHQLKRNSIGKFLQLPCSLWPAFLSYTLLQYS